MGLLVLYGWILASTDGLPRISGRQSDYNNLLVHGFLQGHLYLDAPVPEQLLALKNPYDPAQRPFGLGLHDASLYRGHYYIYFGPAPALALMLPFAALTGSDLPVGYAVGIFVVGMSAALLAIFLRYVGRRERGRWVTLACVIALGTCGFQLALLSRHTMYELAIAGGACFFLWSLYFLLAGGAHCPQRAGSDHDEAPNSTSRAAHCTAAGLCLGLAIASRPIYLFTTVLLFLPLFRPRDFKPFAFAAASCALVVGGLLLYNYARFGRFSEFGQNYQLSGAIEGQVRHFGIHNVPFNLRVYFLAPLRYGRYFPFVHPILVPPYPAGFGSYEEAFGLLPNFAIYLFTTLGLYFAFRNGLNVAERGSVSFSDRVNAQLDLRVLALAGLILTTVLLLFFGSVVRYEADFCGPLLLLACCGAVELNSRLKTGASRRLFAGLTVCAAAFSTFVAVMTGVTLYHDFATVSPGQYALLTRWLSVPAAGLEQIGVLSPPGPRKLRLSLSPPVSSPPREPILTTGWVPETDSLWAVYPRPGYVRFQLVHGSVGILAVSPEYELGSAPLHELTLDLGSLYPPDDAPYYRHLSARAIGADRTAWSVTLDGRPAWRLATGFFDSTPGTARYGPAVKVIRPVAATPLDYQLPTSRLALEFTLQASWAGRSFPLATRGRTYAGDTLFVHIVDEKTITFGYDHWSHPAIFSPPIPWVMGRPHGLTIDFPVPSPNQEQGIIQFSSRNQTLWAPKVYYYAAGAYELFPAQNLIGSTSCESVFPGCSARFEATPPRPRAE